MTQHNNGIWWGEQRQKTLNAIAERIRRIPVRERYIEDVMAIIWEALPESRGEQQLPSAPVATPPSEPIPHPVECACGCREAQPKHPYPQDAPVSSDPYPHAYEVLPPNSSYRYLVFGSANDKSGLLGDDSGPTKGVSFLNTEAVAQGNLRWHRCPPPAWAQTPQDNSAAAVSPPCHPECDWPEDAKEENGQYYNVCANCHITFVGHKHRQLCKLCAVAPPPSCPPANPAWAEQPAKDEPEGWRSVDPKRGWLDVPHDEEDGRSVIVESVQLVHGSRPIRWRYEDEGKPAEYEVAVYWRDKFRAAQAERDAARKDAEEFRDRCRAVEKQADEADGLRQTAEAKMRQVQELADYWKDQHGMACERFGVELRGWKRLINDTERVLGMQSFAVDPSARSMVDRADEVTRMLEKTAAQLAAIKAERDIARGYYQSAVAQREVAQRRIEELEAQLTQRPVVDQNLLERLDWALELVPADGEAYRTIRDLLDMLTKGETK